MSPFSNDLLPAFQGEQGVCAPEEPGRGREHLHRQPRPRGRREAPLRHLLRLRRHPHHAEDTEGSRDRKLEGKRLHSGLMYMWTR